MDYIPYNYLISLRSTKQLRLSILPKHTNMLAPAGLELGSSDSESCIVPLDHTRSPVTIIGKKVDVEFAIKYATKYFVNQLTL